MSLELSPAERTRWLALTASHIAYDFTQKYVAGEVEHKGDIGAVPTTAILREMRCEALDQLAYAAELDRRLRTHVLISRKSLNVLMREVNELSNSTRPDTDHSVRMAYTEALDIMGELGQPKAINGSTSSP